MRIESVIPLNTCCDMRDSWNVISKLSDEFWVVVHWPSGCENEISYNPSFASAVSFSTGLNEIDITLGTWLEKLFSKVEEILSCFPKIKILFVLWTCSSELIGDDIDALIAHFWDSISIMPIHTSWMRGSGYHYTKYTIFQHLFSLSWERNIDEKSINILFQDGMQNEAFQEELSWFLDKFWIKVNAFLNTSLDLDQILSLNQAKYNYLVWENSDFKEVLDFVQQNYHISYKVLDVPFGLTKTNKFLSSICMDFWVSLKDYTVEFIKHKNKRHFSSFSIEETEITFSTNFRDYQQFLADIGIPSSFVPELSLRESKNTSHKFNFENKILISSVGNLWKESPKILSSYSFQTMNRYIGFSWMENFIRDLQNQLRYRFFLLKYRDYL